MPPEPTPEDAAKKAAAEEQAKKDAALALAAAKKVCAEQGHVWSLPEKNPFNTNSLVEKVSCRRCTATGKMAIAIDP